MKMKYYQMLTCCRAKKNAYIWHETNMKEYGLDESSFLEGRDFSSFSGRLKVEPGNRYGQYGDLDDGLQGTMVLLPVISAAVKEKFIERGVDGLQYIPVDVKTENGELEYWIVNCTYCTDAFDYENSTYIKKSFFTNDPRDDKIIRYVKHYVLDEEKVLGHDMFVLDYYPYRRVIVSGKIKNIFLKYKFSGWGFYPTVSLSRDGKIIE